MRKKRMTISHFITGVERQRGQYRFTVKEKEDGTPWIAGEPVGDTLKIIGPKGDDLEIGFMLRPGTTIQQAHEVARCMNNWIVDTVLF
jgi:hypothetical protein